MDHNLQCTLRTVKKNIINMFAGNTTAGNGLTFYFKVNGRPIFMKGSNWIPANILPELGSNKETGTLTNASRNFFGLFVAVAL